MPPARLKARTCGPPPGPAPVMISATPSPVTSPAATLTPPANAGSYAKKLATSVGMPPARLKARTCGPPPGPAPVMTSAHAVAGHVSGRHADAARERRGVCEEVRNLCRRAARQAEGPHLRPAAGPCPGDDLGDAVAGHVPDRHADAAANAGSYAKKFATSVGVPPARLKTRTCGPPPGPGPGDDVGDAVAGHVSGRHADAAWERRVEREETRDICHDAGPFVACITISG